MKIIQKKKSIKESFYQVSYNPIDYILSTLLWQESFPRGISYFLFFLGKVQLVMALLWTQLNLSTSSEKQDPFTYFLSNIADIVADSEALNIKNKFNSLGLRITALCLYQLIFILVLLKLMIGIKFNYNMKKLELILCSLCAFHHEFIYWYVNLTVLRGLKQTGLEFELFGAGFTTGTWEAYLILVVLSIMNFAYWLVSVIFRFDPFKTKDLVSCWKPLFHITTGVLKTALSVILVCFPRDHLTVVIFWMIAAAALTFQKYSLHRDIPFYYQTTMKVAICFNTTALVIVYPSALITISGGINFFSQVTLTYGQMLLLVLGIKIGLGIYDKQQSSALNKLIEGPKTESEVFQTMQALNRIFEMSKLTMDSYIKSENIDEAYWYAMMKYHGSGCKEENCACKLLLSNDKKMVSLIDVKNQINMIAQDILYDFIKLAAKNLKSYRIKIYLSFLELKRRTSGRVALINLFGIPKHELSFLARVGLEKLILRLKENLNHYYNQNNEHGFNITELFDYEQSSTKFLDKIKKAMAEYIDFWNLFNQNKIKSSSLISSSKKFETTADNIDKLWNDLNTRYPAHSRMYSFEYAKYLTIYRNSQAKAEKCIKMFNDWYSRNSKNIKSKSLSSKNILDPQNLIVFVSMDKDNLGIVLDASNSVEALGYKRSELLGENINTLLMTCLQQPHHIYLQQHIESNPSEERLYKKIRTFAKNKRGAIIEVEAFLAISPKFTDELVYIGILRQINHEKDYIIINSNGVIDSFTEGLLTKYGLELSFGENLRQIFDGTAEIDRVIENQRLVSINSKASKRYQSILAKDLIVTTQTIDQTANIFEVSLKDSCDDNDRFQIILEKVCVLGTHFFSLEIALASKQKNSKQTYACFEQILEGDEADIDEGKLANPTVYPMLTEENNLITQNTWTIREDIPNKNIKLSRIEEESNFKDSYDFESYEEEDIEQPKQTLKKAVKQATSQASSGTTRSTYLRQEAGIFDIKYPKSLRWLSLLLLLYWIQATISLVEYSSIRQGEMSLMRSNMDFILYLDNLTSSYANHLIPLHQARYNEKGYLTEFRYTVSSTNKEYLTKMLKHLFEEYTSTFQQYLDHHITPNPILSYKIQMKPNEYFSAKQVNLQGYFRLAISALERIIFNDQYNPSNLIDINTVEKYDFMVLNTTKYIIKDAVNLTRELFNSSSVTLGVLIAFIVLIGVIIIFMEIKLRKNYEDSKRKFCEALNRFEPSIIDDHLVSLKLRKAGSYFSKIKAKNNKDKNKNKTSRLYVEYEKDSKSYKNCILLTISVLIYISCLAVIQIQLLIDMSNGNELLNSIDQIEYFTTLDIAYLEMQPLLFQYMFPYYDSPYVDGNLDEIWSDEYDNILLLQNKLRILINKQAADDKIMSYLTGDLCELLKYDSICDKPSKYYTNGIYGFNNAIGNLMNELKSMARDADSSMTYLTTILNSQAFKDYESLFLDDFEKAYLQIRNAAMYYFNDAIQNEIQVMNQFWLTYLFILFFVSLFDRFALLGPMFKASRDLRKIVRMIPMKMVMSNNFIKAYIRENCSKEFEHFFK